MIHCPTATKLWQSSPESRESPKLSKGAWTPLPDQNGVVTGSNGWRAVIASEARGNPPDLDCFVTGAPRNDKSPSVNVLPVPKMVS